MQSAVILIHRSHLRLKTFKLQQTEMACLMVSETKLIVKTKPVLKDKASKVINQLSPSMPHENNMITKTITDFAFSMIKALTIIIKIACRSSNKKTIFILRGQISLYWPTISETAQTQKKKLSLLKRG